MSEFPHSQHKPVPVTLRVQIPIINSMPEPRWNFNKADWTKFQKILCSTVHWIPQIPQNYRRFRSALISSEEKSIPRRYRKNYIPGWSEDSKALHQVYLSSGDPEDDIIHSLDNTRRGK
ncbi:hypothetical protein JTB14_030855 [Gonioctena quinquepunctata]|nr:hypothetical protein JTB14_030855 [Gonioctena quinquepunctata]